MQKAWITTHECLRFHFQQLLGRALLSSYDICVEDSLFISSATMALVTVGDLLEFLAVV